MAKAQNTTTLFPEFPNLLDQAGFRDGWKVWAELGSRLSGVTLDSASKSADIAVEASKETISNLRDITTVRDDASDYAQAFNGFVQSQADLTRRTAEAFFGLAQRTGTEATEIVSDAGETLSETATGAANDVADKTASKARKAA